MALTSSARTFFSAKTLAFTLVLASSLLSGCANFEFPWVYKVEVQQGNIITQEMINQLKPGMTKRQVRFVMGSPLISDTLNPNRWDYFYSLRKGNGDLLKERVTIYFQDDKLSYFVGDYRPTADTSED